LSMSVNTRPNNIKIRNTHRKHMLRILLSLHCLQYLKCFSYRFWISWCGSWWRSAHWHIDMLLHLSVTVLWNWSQKLGRVFQRLGRSTENVLHDKAELSKSSYSSKQDRKVREPIASVKTQQTVC